MSALPPPELDGVSPAELDAEVRQFTIGPALHGQRIDHALVELAPEFSRNYLQQLMHAGAVQLAGRVVAKASARVKAGESGSIELRATPQSQAFKPEQVSFETVFCDEHLRIVHKPAGLVVHPAPGNWSGTLLNGLLALDDLSCGLPRAGIVHRLDKDTSGLMLVARTRPMMDALVDMIAARAVSRQYLAICTRSWSGPPTRDIDLAIGRDPRNRLRMAVVDLANASGKAAQTTVELLDTSAQASLVRCTLHTGRTHQIRVHLAAIGYPLLADAVYGGVAAGGMQRQALHAWRLALKHPHSGKELVFHAALPQDMADALPPLGLSYNQTLLNRQKALKLPK